MSVRRCHEKGNGLDVRELCRWEVGTAGMVTDDSEIFRLGNLESEVVAGPCGAHTLIHHSLK